MRYREQSHVLSFVTLSNLVDNDHFLLYRLSRKKRGSLWLQWSSCKAMYFVFTVKIKVKRSKTSVTARRAVARAYRVSCKILILIRTEECVFNIKSKIALDRMSCRHVCVKYITMYNIDSNYWIGII